MQKFIIDNKNQGQTLFRFIKKALPGLKNSEIFKLIRKKIITVNNKKKDSNYTLFNNDIINIYLKKEHIKEKGKKKKFQTINKTLDVIFEDNDVLIVNKPKGLLTHPDKNQYKNNLHESVRSYLYKKGEYDPGQVFTPTPCHRLDKNTSGIIVIAKNHLSLQNITNMFRERKPIKKYKALVFSQIKKDIFISSIIDSSENMVKVKNLKISKNIPEKESFFIKNPEFSATLVIPEKISSNYSLVNVELWTGKKHQIRAHLCAIGNPLLGDKKYYNSKSKNFSEKLKINNYYLHSYQLKLDNYTEWTAPIPVDFKNRINELFME